MGERYHIIWKERRSGKPDTNDYRTPWEHDYGRIIHSASLRRLQAKTQILGVGEGDFHRTRLTHTLEVSQIGMSITKRLRKCYQKKDPRIARWLPKPALIQSICLAHDLGHPPFGHDGEVALNRCMLDHGGFEGNGQTLRIITKLEEATKQYGLDLTRRTVLGTIKYPARYDKVNNTSVYPLKSAGILSQSVFKASDYKPPKCYLGEEHEDIVLGWLAKGIDDWPEFATVTKKRNEHHSTEHKSLDASIMELADDVAYGVHDLEDAIALKIIDRRMFEEWFEECNRRSTIDPLLTASGIGPKFQDLVDRLFSHHTHERKQVIGRLVGALVGAIEIIPNPNFQTPLFKYRADLRCPERCALKTLKDIVRERVINSLGVQQLRFKGQKIVTELFHAFITDPKRLLNPSDYKRSTNGGDSIPIERVICDHIAGMTDEYAIKRYRQMFVPRAGSVFDRI